jgi:O-acetyl-ADP-ribose deacetylase (regulator of RNase III)
MQVKLFVGDIADAPADVVCTSTNPRLTLMMGTGASIRERGGFEVLRACESIVGSARSTGRSELAVGSVHVTTAGRLPFRAIVHCVASGAAHRSSAEIVQVVVARALAAAASLGVRSVAMPLFGTGHARLKPVAAAEAIAAALAASDAPLEQVVVVVRDAETAALVEPVFSR